MTKRVLILVVCVLALLTGCVDKDTRAFNQAVELGTIDAYAAYLAQYSDHRQELRPQMYALCMAEDMPSKTELSKYLYHFKDEEGFGDVQQRFYLAEYYEYKPFTTQNLQNFIDTRPDNPHVDEAVLQLHSLRFEKAKEGGRNALRQYILDELEAFQDEKRNAAAEGREPRHSPHVEEAQQLYEELIWAEAAKSDEGLRLYLQNSLLRLHEAEAIAMQEDNYWQRVQTDNSLEGYNNFLALYPDSPRAEQAKTLTHDLLWDAATKDGGDVALLEQYKQNYPEGEHVGQVDGLIDEIQWFSFSENATVSTLLRYIEEHGDSSHIKEAKAMLKEKRNDDGYYEAFFANGTTTVEQMEAFLAQYPGHAREGDAHKTLRALKGASLAQLVKDGSLSITITGKSITTTKYSIKNETNSAIKVFIPFGTWFDARSSGVQNMIVTEEKSFTIGAGQTSSGSIGSACLNISKKIPGSSDSFAVKEYEADAKLSRLMKLLNDEGAGYYVKQCAVWIVQSGVSDSRLTNSLVDQYRNKLIHQVHVDEARRIIDML